MRIIIPITVMLLWAIFGANRATAADGEATVDTNTIKSWNKQAFDLAYSDPGAAMAIARKSLAAAKDLHYTKGCVIALIRIGIIHDVQSRNDSAIAAYQKAGALAGEINDSLSIAAVLTNIGLIYWKINKLDSAFNNFNSAYRIFESFGAQRNMASVANNIGLIYDEMERSDMALAYFAKARHYYNNIGDTVLIYDVYTNMADVYESFDNKDSVRHYLNMAIAGYRKTGNRYRLGSALANLALSERKDSQYQDAVAHFKEAMAIAKMLGNNYSYVSTGYNFSICYKLMGRYDDQLALLKELLPVVLKLNSNELRYKIYHELAEANYRIGNIDRGKTFYFESEKFRDAYSLDIINENLAEAEKKYEVEESRRKIAELQNEKLASDIKLADQNNLLLISLMLLITGGLGVGLFLQRFWNSKEKEKAAAILQERDRGLKAIIDAQEEERVRIARELHDGVGNKLLALKMRMGSLITPTEDTLTDEDKTATGTMLADIMQEVRNVSHQMMPKTLQEFGCVPAIEYMLQEVLGYSGIQYHFETHNVDKRYHRRLETTIYRVAQELISNVVKHSGATEVSVQLVETNGHLVLFVEDNGKGINPQTGDSTGIGLASLKSRINAVNGDLDLAPGTHSGTVATIRIPIA